MNVKITKEYWVLGDKEKEFFLTGDSDYCDWEHRINYAMRFPTEQGAAHFNNTRVYDIVSKHEVSPIKVTESVEF